MDACSTQAESINSQDGRFETRTIHSMLQDPIIQVYFVLAAPIVQEFERVSNVSRLKTVMPKKCLNLSTSSTKLYCTGNTAREKNLHPLCVTLERS